jgi:hypothetical protein
VVGYDRREQPGRLILNTLQQAAVQGRVGRLAPPDRLAPLSSSQYDEADIVLATVGTKQGASTRGHCISLVLLGVDRVRLVDEPDAQKARANSGPHSSGPASEEVADGAGAGTE